MKHRLLFIGLFACNLAVLPVMAGNLPSNLDSSNSSSDQEQQDPNQKKQDSDKEQAAQSSDASNGDAKEEPSEQNSASDSESDADVLPPLTDSSDSDNQVADFDKGTDSKLEESNANSESDNGAGLPPSSDSSSSDSEVASDKGTLEGKLDGSGSGNDGNQNPNGPQGPKDPNGPHGSTVLTALKSYTKTQLVALVGAALIIGYGAYKGYQVAMAWWQSYQEGEQHIQLTMRECAILRALSEAMTEDVKQAYEGKKLPSQVAQFDVGGLRMPVAIQCNYIQTGFIDLYNRCDEKGHNVEALNIFYHQINDILEAMIEQAEIVAEA